MRGRRFTADGKAGLLLLSFSLVYLILALRIPASSFASADVGPKGFPLGIGLALATAATALVVRGQREPGADPLPAIAVDDEELPPADPLKFGVVVLLLLVYILTFTALGYVLATFLFIAGTTTFLDRRRLLRNLLFGLGFPLVVYAVFTRLLGITLPAGLLG